VIGLAIFNKQYLSFTFTLLLYKKLLNKPLEISDLEYVDPEMFKHLKHLKYLKYFIVVVVVVVIIYEFIIFC